MLHLKKKFIEPTAETDTLATIGLEDEYEPIIMAGVAAQMMAGRDIPTATADYISDQISVLTFLLTLQQELETLYLHIKEL